MPQLTPLGLKLATRKSPDGFSLHVPSHMHSLYADKSWDKHYPSKVES